MKHDELVKDVRAIERVVKAKAGVAERGAQRAQIAQLTIVEKIPDKRDSLDVRRAELANLHRLARRRRAVKKLQVKGQALIAPERLLGAKPDVAHLVVAELGQALRQLAVGLLVGRGRALGGELRDVIVGHLQLLDRRADGAGRQKQDARDPKREAPTKGTMKRSDVHGRMRRGLKGEQ